MVKFSELASQNPWWKYGKDFQRFDKHLNDLQEQTIQLKRKPIPLQAGTITIIRGCRQIGKTTYVKQIIANLINEGFEPRTILYLSVDQLIKTRRELRNILNDFLEQNIDAEQVYILLDEITALPEWNQELKTLADTGTTRKARIIVTGSSGAALRNTGEQLPGRGLEGNEYNIKPLTFREFLHQTIDYFSSHSKTNELTQALTRLKETLPKAKLSLQEDTTTTAKTCHMIIPYLQELNYLLKHYLRCGGFPNSINSYLKQDTHKIEPAVAENFVRITLGSLAEYGKNETTARQLLDEIIIKYATTFSFTNLTDQVNHVTTNNYLDYLEKSFLLHIHYAIDLNKKTPKYKGQKKAYFQDPFIYYSLKSWLTGTDINDAITSTIEDENQLSKIIEGVITSHLTAARETPVLREKNTFIWYYYDQRKREIDNIIKIDKNYDAVEVKYRNNVGTEDATKTQGIRQTIILSRDDYETTENTIVIPTSVYLALIERSQKNL